MKKSLIGAFIFLLFVFSVLPIIDHYLKETNASNPEETNTLPTIGSYGHFKFLLKDIQQSMRFVYGKANLSGVLTDGIGAAENSAVKVKSDLGEVDYSLTNVQVSGVDEADVVKTDGKYIYQISNRNVVITQAYPTEEMKIIQTISYDDNSFNPQEIYLDEKYLTVLGTSFSQKNMAQDKKYSSSNHDITYPNFYQEAFVKAIIYQIEDGKAVKQREVSVEGQYASSRKIGSSVYLIANKYIDIYRILNDNIETPTPMYNDSATGETKRLGYDQIYYLPGSVEANYLMIAGLNLEQPNEEVHVNAYLGAGQNIYTSQKNLYVAATMIENDNVKDNQSIGQDRYTKLYKFSMNDGISTFQHEGQVPGNIINQFSMDEHNNYFRIATTTGNLWSSHEDTAKNNLYVLDENLNTIGKIEGIAPGERIYSVRFMGNRAYMVTFKKVDPLFVIDLQYPEAPKILGKLKIPGYSDYLHPYDENHLIGFGKDTVEAKEGNFAYYQGMKIAIFDVTDVKNPKEKFVEIIGARGTESPLLHNHKALLFSKEKNLLAFPVMLMENNNSANSMEYGQFTFQGAYIYHIDLKNGFKLEKRITHISEAEYQKSGNSWYNSSLNIERIIYVGDNLYTISKGMIKAFSMSNFEEMNHIVIPFSQNYSEAYSK